MTTPTTPISLADIRSEFGPPGDPIPLRDYYRGLGYVPYEQGDAGGYGYIPEYGSGSTPISMYNFRNKQKYVSGAVGFGAAGVTAFYVPLYLQFMNIRAMGGGGGGGGGSFRSGRETYEESVGAGGGGGISTVLQSRVAVIPGSTIYIVVGDAGTAGSPRDGLYSAGSDGGPGGYSGVLNPEQSAWYCLSYGGGGGQVGQPNARSAGGVRGIDRAYGVGAVYNYGYNSGYGTQGLNDTVLGIYPKSDKYNVTGGTGGQGYTIWGDSSGTTGQGGSYDSATLIGNYGISNATTANMFGGGGGGGSGWDPRSRGSASTTYAAPGNVGGVILWW